MFRITIDNEEVLCDKDITIKEEMLNTPSVILNNVFPKSWEATKDYTTNFYHPDDYSKCIIADEDYIEESEGTTAEGSNLSITYDDRRNFEYNLKGDTYQYTTTGKNLYAFGDLEETNTYYYMNKRLLNNFENNTTYTLSFDIQATREPFIISIGYGNDSFQADGAARSNNTSGHQSFTFTTSNSTYSNLWFRVPRYSTLDGSWSATITNIQLEKGSQETSFEPYTNGASPNPDYPQNIEVVSGRQDINVCGKNLLKYPYKNTTQTISDVTFADNGDGSITVNGTNSSSSQILWYLSENKWTYKDLLTYELEPGTYTFKGIGTDKVTMHVNMYKSDNTNEYFPIQINSVTKTITEKVRLNIRLGVYANQTVNNYTIYPMIEKSNQSSTYEEYKGKDYEINLGKNLILLPDVSRSVNGLTGTFEGNTITINGTNEKTDSAWVFLSTSYATLPDFKPGETYTVSATKQVPNVYFQINYYKKGTTTAAALFSLNLTNTNKLTFTVPNEFEKVVSTFLGITKDAGTIDDSFNVQLEKGQVATSYSPYRSYTKNLFDKDTADIEVAYINSSTGAIVSGGQSTTIKYYPVDPNTQYTLTIVNQQRLAFYNSNKEKILVDTTTNNTFTTPEGTKYFSVQAQTASFDRNTIQLEKGSQKTSFVPYMSQIELCKIGNYQDYLKKSSGKNLFDISQTLIGKAWNGDNNSARAVCYLECKPNTTYTISFGNISGVDGIYNFEKANISDATVTSSLSQITTTKTITTKETSNYLGIQFNKSAISLNDISKINLQVNEGTYTSQTIPPYEPYGTGWYVEKEIDKYTFASNDNWVETDNHLQGCYTVYKPTPKKTLSSTYIPFCSNLKGVKNPNYGTQATPNSIGVSADRFNVYIPNITTTSDCKTTMANQTIYYVLATPTYIEIVDEELISQLESVRLLSGLNNIMISSAYLQAIMNLHYNFNEGYYYMNQLYFSGVVKNSGNISLNPREPHFQTLQILDFKTFLSEGETLDRVIYNKTILETIQEVIGVISGYGFVLGNVQIANPNDVIGAYSTENKTAYDIFNYIAEITQSKWTTRLVDENTVAIDFYDPSALPQGTPIEYNTTYFKNNLIDNMFYSYSSNDYRNKQIMTSKEVFANISTKETIISSGYGSNFLLEQPVGQVENITLNNVEMSFATKQDKELGYSADFYYSVGSNSIESDVNIPLGSSIVIQYIPIVSGRQVIANDNEISRISGATGRNGIITRYENRNDASTSTELQMIGQSYIKYKGSPEIKLTVETRSNLWKIGDRVQFNAPIPELATEYMVKSKKIQYIPTIDEIFYTFEMSSSFNSEQDINYFDNQRAKALGNIKEGSYISRNIDIENVANITFQNVLIEKINSTGDNKLNATLNSPIVQ